MDIKLTYKTLTDRLPNPLPVLASLTPLAAVYTLRLVTNGVGFPDNHLPELLATTTNIPLGTALGYVLREKRF